MNLTTQEAGAILGGIAGIVSGFNERKMTENSENIDKEKINAFKIWSEVKSEIKNIYSVASIFAISDYVISKGTSLPDHTIPQSLETASCSTCTYLLGRPVGHLIRDVYVGLQRG